MKKEVVFIISIGLFLFAYALDYFAGPLRLRLTSPILFLTKDYLSLYPMTFVSIIIRSSAILLSVALILSLIEKKYLTKIGVTAFLAFIAEIYAFQQLATGAKTSSLIWTLSISYGGAFLILLIVFYIFAAVVNFLIPQNKNEVRLPKSLEDDGASVLNP